MLAPARDLVRRRADHEKAGPQGPLRKPGAAMMQSVRNQAKYRHSTEPGLGVGRILSPQARPAWPARMRGSEADHPCAQPRTNRRTQAQRERCRPMIRSRHSSAIEPVSHASLGNNDTARQSAPRKQEGKRESAFMTPVSRLGPHQHPRPAEERGDEERIGEERERRRGGQQRLARVNATGRNGEQAGGGAAQHT